MSDTLRSTPAFAREVPHLPQNTPAPGVARLYYEAHITVEPLAAEGFGYADFVEATGYRSLSMYEYALEKRARAQIKRKESQIDQIAERMAPAAIEAPAAPVIDIAMKLYGDAAEAVPAAPLAASVSSGVPVGAWRKNR